MPAPVFKSLLRQQRLAAGLTQAALAERAGLAARTIQDLERGLALPRRETVRRIVEALDLAPEVRTQFEAVTSTPRAGATGSGGDLRAGLTEGPFRSRQGGSVSPEAWGGTVGRLPAPLTSFVGRSRDLAVVTSLLPTARLLTLTGVGGIGKTRLVVEAARMAGPAYADGVWFVELALLGDPSLVPRFVATTLQVRQVSGQPVVDLLCAMMHSKDALLVLDNCEHVVDGCARMTERLLEACPGLRVLATSREPLGVPGEIVWRVPPLAVAGADMQRLTGEDIADYGALNLFFERARLVRPDLEMTDDTARVIADICRKLDGIPLAIELAAARISVLTVSQIADRLDDQLTLLTGGPRTATSRHRALAAALDWSHDLVSEAERTVFHRLAVFAGGWTLEAAESVCADDRQGHDGVLDHMSRLVDASLVVVEEWRKEARYRLLEPVRQYALEQLRLDRAEDTVRDRHAAWCLAVAERAAPLLWTGEQRYWLARLDVEHDNLRAALAWCLTQRGNADVGVRLAGALHRYWFMRGQYGEGGHWLELALRRADDVGAPVTAQTLFGAGLMAYGQNDWERSTTLCERAAVLAREQRDARHESLARSYIGFIAQNQRCYQGARREHEQALIVAHDHGDQIGTAVSLEHLGRLAEREGDYAQADSLLNQALALHRARGDTVGAAWTLTTLALVARRQGAYDRAVALGEESLDLYREIWDRNGTAFAMQNLGRAAHLQGDRSRARSHFEESIRLWRDIGNQAGALRSLEGLGAVMVAEGKPARAVQVLAATAALNEAIDRVLSPAEQAVYEQLVAASRAELDDAVFEAARLKGRAMTFEQAVACALERSGSTR